MKDLINAWQNSDKYKRLMAEKKANEYNPHLAIASRFDLIQNKYTEDQIRKVVMDWVNEYSMDEYEDLVAFIIQKFLIAKDYADCVVNYIAFLTYTAVAELQAIEKENFEQAEMYNNIFTGFSDIYEEVLCKFETELLDEIEPNQNMFEFAVMQKLTIQTHVQKVLNKKYPNKNEPKNKRP